LTNRDLKLRNESRHYFVHFFIQSNNPHHYKVFPASGDIPPNKVLEISIQIVGLEDATQLKRVFFGRFAADKFKISWNAYKESDKLYDQNISKIKKPHNFKVLPVRILYDEEEKAAQHEVRSHPAALERKVEQSLEVHRLELARLEEMIGQKKQRRVGEAWLHPRCTALLCLAAFLLGLLLPL
jgi:hypothetical protein